MNNTLYLFILLIFLSCTSQSDQKAVIKSDPTITVIPDSIISKLFKSDTLKQHGIFSTEWQDEIDKALIQDSTIAYLWQQKSMPLYKQGKYQLGRPFLDKAAKFKPEEYLEYRAFMICIFEKNYPEAIREFKSCITQYGDSYVMDHSYSFYIALSKIQLNEFQAAEVLLENEIQRQKETFGPDNVHFLDHFYLGIARYEQNEFQSAIEAFDQALIFYTNFGDAQLYKAQSLGKLGKYEEAKELLKIAKANGKAGHTINEDNVVYERYPYQIRWKSQ